MSGGPPPPSHHHGRQVPTANTAWNHLQVPFFPSRQPQHAHMSNEHPILHQPTWHTPTTEPLKTTTTPASHIFNLEQMLSERPFPRHSPGVDLSVTRNGGQNGDMPTTPISLSVRDTNKINSLAASALDIQGTELKSLSPGLKSLSPSLKPASPGLKTVLKSDIALKLDCLKSNSPGLPVDKQNKKAKRVDSILERLNPQVTEEKTEPEKPSVIVQAGSSHDENSNSSSILNVPTPTAIREDEVVSPYSNEDSLDSNKSRRKRKPSKTIRVPKEAEILHVQNTLEPENEKKIPERRKSASPEPVPRKTRRKTSSESETIDKIAAMVQETSKKEEILPPPIVPLPPVNPITNIPPILPVVVTPAQKKDFVAVEDKLEEMFAGLEDSKTPVALTADESKIGFNDTNELLALDTPSTSQGHDNVTSTSSDIKKQTAKRRKLSKKNNFDGKKKNSKKEKVETPKKTIKKVNGKTKVESIKDVYAYDSGSNASSSRSRGPFVHIRGPRDSPVSVSVVNTPVSEEDPEKKPNKVKKFHDDTEYRHKVRSKGLHCSTLSNKYDAQTKDTSWICVFCKRGPYSGEAYYTPGDLFGPYVITNSCGEFERRLDDPYDKNFKSKKVVRTLEAVTATSGAFKPKKSKRKNSEGTSEDANDVIGGVTVMDEKNFEIWTHEDCVVWSPGIYLVGPKIVGLEEAVWTCSNVSCTRCQLKGANVCCLRRGCPCVVHVGCAVLSNWQLDENNYKAYCAEHRITV